MQRLKELLVELCKISAVSGDEREAQGLLQLLRKNADGVKLLSGGSFIAYKKSGKVGAKKILIDAHLDQIGLMVTKVDERGFIHFCNHAGVDAKVLPGAEVSVMTRTGALSGVISAKPPHLLDEKDREKPTQIKDMTIDVGLDKQRVCELVAVGDKIALQGDIGFLLGSRMTGRSLDNRAGCAVLVAVLEAFKTSAPNADVYAVFSSGEEFGGYGAAAAAKDIEPDEAIVIDVSHADMPGAKSDEVGTLGKGAMIGISPILDREMSEYLIALAKRDNIPYQVEAMAGKTGTNCDSVMHLCGGIPTALLSIPLRYMHTPQEVVSLEDMVSLKNLLTAYLG